MSKSKAKSAGQKAAAATAAAPRLPLALRLAPVIVTGLLLFGIFSLPYYIPLHTPSQSQSWEFGFNNTVAQGLIAILLLLLFAWQLLFGRREIDANGPIARVLLQEPEPLRSRTLLYVMGIAQMGAAMVTITWFSLLPMSHYGEITYFIQRLEAMLLGQAPYVDFAFDYGPFMLDLPAGIYHLFHGAVSVEAAYAATLIIHFTIGMGLIAYVVSQVNARGRPVIMAFIGFQWINPTMGLNYTPLRFTIALASLFGIRHLLRITRDSSRRLPLLGLAALLFPAINFAISPEMGVALTLALCVYFGWFLFCEERRLAILVLPVLAGAALTAFVFPRPYFDSILSFGKGGANFPIFPTIHILAFLAVAIWIFPRLGVFAVRDKSAAGPFCAGLAILCGMFILPATGRCDPGHIWINSVPILLIALAAASWLPKRWWYTAWVGYFLIFPVTLEMSNWVGYQNPIESALAVRGELSGMQYDADNYAHLAPGAPRPPLHYSKLLPTGELDTLPQAKIGVPLGDNETVERFLKLTGRYVPEYHIPPYADVFAPSDMDRKFKDMQKMDYIFVPTYYLGYLRPIDQAAQARAQADADNKYISSLLFFPIDLPLVHPLLQQDRNIMLEIARNYRPVRQYQGGWLLKRMTP
jgi:hypothetical protein